MNASSSKAPTISGCDAMPADRTPPRQPTPLPLAPVGGKAVERDCEGVDCLPMPVSSGSKTSLTNSASRATWRPYAKTRVIHAVSPSPEKTCSNNGCITSSRATKRPTMPIRCVTTPSSHCGAIGCLQPATLWPRNRRCRALQTVSRALHSPAWLGYGWITVSPPMPSRPRSSCSMWMTPRPGAMATRNMRVTMASMAGIVVCRCTSMRVSRDA